MENLEKPGTPEWKLIEHSRRHLEQVDREASGRMERDTEAMKEQARRHLANIEADAAGRRGPLRQSHVDAMREVEEQYPLDPKSEPDTWVDFAKLSPRQYIALLPQSPIFYEQFSAIFSKPLSAIAHYARTAQLEWDDFVARTGPPEPPTIRGKPAGRVRACHHGNPRGRCRECSGVGRRR